MSRLSSDGELNHRESGNAPTISNEELEQLITRLNEVLSTDGFLILWVYGCMGVWCMDVWMYGFVCLFVCERSLTFAYACTQVSTAAETLQSDKEQAQRETEQVRAQLRSAEAERAAVRTSTARGDLDLTPCADVGRWGMNR